MSLVFDNDNCNLVSFTIIDAATLPDNAHHLYPDGLASFSLSCSSSYVEIHWPDSSLEYGYAVHKYGPVAPDFTSPDAWYAFPSATLDTDSRVVSFTLTDGALGDGTAIDGLLVDPVGVASTTTEPGLNRNTSLPVNNTLALLATLAGLMTIGFWGRRRLLKVTSAR